MNFSINQSFLSILLASLFLLVSCSNPAGGEEEHHESPVGAVFLVNGDEIARYDGDVTGSLTVPAEGAVEITIQFLSEDGDLYQPDAAEYSLEWTVTDESVATISADPAAQEWVFTLQGVSTGNTEATFRLIHDDHNHSEMATEPIPVDVTGAG